MSEVAIGNKKACRQFVDDYMPLIYRVIIRTVGNVDVAQDLSHEVFIKVWVLRIS